MKRSSGVLMHISMLWGDYSIGGFGKAALEFIDFLYDCGFTYWQVLPFSVPDEYNSPYKSYSAFGGNPYFIDMEILLDKGLITKEELDSMRQTTPYVCEYDELRRNRLQILKKASERVDEDMREKIEQYADSNPRIKELCVFMSLKEKNDGKPWSEFKYKKYDEATLFMWKFIQYEFFKQWQDIKGYANERGISIIGDIPIYVSYDSADVYFEKKMFDLDRSGRSKSVAGVPPDYFCEEGQLWGNPLYKWNVMKKDGYSWWRERVSYNLSLFDGIRLDHFRAFESFWSVPASAETAMEGKWLKAGGTDFVDKIREDGKDSLIIAEDLGEITPEVRSLVEYSGFPGMRVFQFADIGNGECTHLPYNYISNCVAYTGTHDNNTLLGYIWELDPDMRRRVFDYCGYYGCDFDEGQKAIIRTIFASHASTVIFPIQDLLGYGRDTRMNTPGRADGNWNIRFTREQVNSIDRGYLSDLNRLYGRNREK